MPENGHAGDSRPGIGPGPGGGVAPDFDRTAVLPPTGPGIGAAPDFDRTAVLPPTAAGAPGPAAGDARVPRPGSGHAGDSGPGIGPGPGGGVAPDFDRTAVLPPTGPGIGAA
ncbi:hypothetical protein ACFW5Y_28965, partial [Streptomyces tendae]